MKDTEILVQLDKAATADYTALRADVVSLLDWLTANVTEF